jgi:hypothetical protein
MRELRLCFAEAYAKGSVVCLFCSVLFCLCGCLCGVLVWGACVGAALRLLASCFCSLLRQLLLQFTVNCSYALLQVRLAGQL